MARTHPINGDLSRRVHVSTSEMPWTASPSGTVWRKRVHLVGPAEAGQVTSVVRYDPRSSFPAHDHPDGEEILVIDGVFSDEHGDWPAGTYLLNPEGFRHAPFSEPGCVLFVKLRQFPGIERQHVAIDTRALGWEAGPAPGIETKRLYEQPGFADRTDLERWTAGSGPGRVDYPDGAEIFVLEGGFDDEDGSHGAGCWLRLPPGYTYDALATETCTVYVKRGGFRYLKSG